MDTELRKDTKDYKNYEIQNTTNLRLPAAGRDDYQYYELIKKEAKAFGFGVSKQCVTNSREVIMLTRKQALRIVKRMRLLKTEWYGLVMTLLVALCFGVGLTLTVENGWLKPNADVWFKIGAICLDFIPMLGIAIFMIWQQESSLSSYKVVKYEFSGEEPIWLLVCKKTKAYVHSFGSSEHAELLSQVQEKELGVYHPGHLTDENFVAGSQNVIIRDQERTVNVGGVNGQPYKEFKVQFTFHFTLCDLRKRFGLDLAAKYQHPNFGWENRLYEWRDDIKKLVTKQLEKGQHGQFANMAAFVQYTKNAMPARVDLYCLKGVKVHLTVIETTVEKFDGDL